MKYSSFILLLAAMSMGLLFVSVPSVWDHAWSGLVFVSYLALLTATAKNATVKDEPV